MKSGKALYSILAVSVIIFFLSAMLFAEETAKKKEDTPKKTENVKKVKEVTTKLQGTIISVDATAGTIIVKTKKENETISIDNATIIKVKKVKKATINDLKSDQSVKVTYKTKEGKKIALKIGAKPVVKAAEKPEKKQPEDEKAKQPEIG